MLEWRIDALADVERFAGSEDRALDPGRAF
jgi:hypothetical protein